MVVSGNVRPIPRAFAHPPTHVLGQFFDLSESPTAREHASRHGEEERQ